MKGRVLIVAGSDSGGGAGIQADIKAVTAMGAFAATAITALTAQNTEGVHGVVAVEPAFIAQQIEVVLSDIGADALKTGMLHSAEVIGTVASSLKKHAPGVPLVVDPVMIAKGGHRLLLSEAEAALRDTLLPMAALVTPNLPEAAVLSGFPVRVEADMRRAAERLLALGAQAPGDVPAITDSALQALTTTIGIWETSWVGGQSIGPAARRERDGGPSSSSRPRSQRLRQASRHSLRCLGLRGKRGRR